MANIPTASSADTRSDYGDPFADRPRQTQFAEPPRPYHANTSQSTLQPYESTTTLPNEFGARYDDDEIEKEPLAQGQNFTGGFYPPGYVFDALCRLYYGRIILTNLASTEDVSTPTHMETLMGAQIPS